MDNLPIILCVDDEHLVLDSLKQQLRYRFGQQFEIETAESGQEALEIIDELMAENLELMIVISDYRMPSMKGDELLAAVHARSPKTLNILLTGQAHLDGVTQAVNQADLYRFIYKPWNEEDLALTIQQAMRRYQQEEQLTEQYERLKELYGQAEAEIEQRNKIEAELRYHHTHLEELVTERTNQLLQRVEEISTLNLIAQTVVTATNLQNILKTIAAAMSRLFKAHWALVSLCQVNTMMLEVVAHYSHSEEQGQLAGRKISLADLTEPTQKVEATQAMFFTDSQSELLVEVMERFLQTEQQLTLLNLPLWARGEVIGLITLTATEIDHVLTENEQQLAKTIAAEIAGAIENARLFQEERRQREIAESLREIAITLNRGLNQAAMLPKILKQLRRVITYDSAGIFMCENDHLVLSDGVGFDEEYLGYRIPLAQSCPEVQVFQYQEPYVIDDVRFHPNWLNWTDDDPICAWVGTPLVIGTESIGILTVDSFEAGHYGEEAALILQTFATQAAIAIQNARLLKEAQRAREAAEAARKVAETANQAKSIFLANMTHELRTPMNAILGFAQVMKRSQTLPQEHQENVNIISRSGEHLLTLINNVLDFSKVEAGKMILTEVNFDLHQLLHDLEDMFGLKAESKRLQLLFELDDNVPRYIRTDELKLRQVLVNLLNNALKFTEEGGVTVRIMQSYGDKRQEDALEQFPSNLCRLYFEVEDTGPGIAPYEMNKLFLAFSQTQVGQQAHEGTGLGLAIGRKFVRLMGGDMQVNSKLGKGAKFSFEIQVMTVDESDIELKQPKRRVVGMEAGEPVYRILIVDDKWTGRQLLRRLLEPLGFELREAENGREAVALWEGWHPHLIWMDLRMPVMDGYEATKKIKSTMRGQDTTIIIALTASVMEEDKAIVMAAGCDDFMRKPFREAEIFDMMITHLGVRFIYEEMTPSELEGPQPEEQTESQLSFVNIPTAFIDDLLQAVERTNVTVVRQIIEEISNHNPILAAHLAKLNDDFEYKKIEALIQEAKVNIHD